MVSGGGISLQLVSSLDVEGWKVEVFQGLQNLNLNLQIAAQMAALSAQMAAQMYGSDDDDM